MCVHCGQLACVFQENGPGGSPGGGPMSSKPVFNNQEVINQIDSGVHWTTSGSVATTLTYGVPTNSSWFPSNYSEYAGWSALNAKQTAVAHQSIELWDDLITTDIVAAPMRQTFG